MSKACVADWHAFACSVLRQAVTRSPVEVARFGASGRISVPSDTLCPVGVVSASASDQIERGL
jgi:hypothetical protein